MNEVLEKQQAENNLLLETQIDNLYAKHYMARKSISVTREDAEKLNRKIAIELLALEWFTKLDSSAETKAYLLENFLPILVLGCEKVLKEAQKKNLIPKVETDPNFNPINRLAQFLMRNNPKSNNHNETSGYVRTTREVYQELRDQLYVLKGNKLATVRDNVRKRRAERERLEKIQILEISKRKSQIESLFEKFNLPVNGRIEFLIVMECLKFYRKYLANFSDSHKKKLEIKHNYPAFCYSRDELNLKKRLMKSDFIETLLQITEDLETENFDIFTTFMEECSIYFVNLANANNLRRILHSLMTMLDSTNTGLLSRRRIVKLLREFKEKHANISVLNPVEWPVLDPFIKFENKLELLIPTSDKKSSEKFSKTLIMSEVSIDQITERESIPKIAEDGLEVENEKSIIINDKVEIDQSENNTTEGNEKLTENEDDKKPEPEDQNKTEIDLENKAQIDDEKSVPNDEILNEPSQAMDLQKSFHKEVSMLNDLKPNSSNLNEVIQSNLSKEEELLFMKGGVFYYTPVNKSFKIDLLEDVQEEISVNTDLMLKFDPEFLNSKQFRNLISTFVSNNFMNSEIYVNDLIVYLKDNYAESRFEKNSKQDKNRKLKQDNYRNKKYTTCFEKLDNEGSGLLSLSVIEDALQDFKDGLFKEQISNSINLMRSEIDGKGDDLINKNEFFDFVSVLVGLVDFPKFEDQLLNYLSCLYTYDINEKTRGEIRKSWLNQIKYVGNITCGSFDPLFKQLFFTLFKDAENHGMKNNISAYIGILENMEDNSIGLKFIASTPHDSKFILGKTLTREDNCISFKVIDDEKPEHVEYVRSNQNVYFFNPSNKNDGSVIIFPLKYARNKVFGTIGIDTMQNTNKNSLFTQHEISFYQGVADSFAVAYAHIVFKNCLIKTCLNAIEWLKIRCKGVDSINLYFVQLLENEANISKNDDQEFGLLNEKYSINLKPIIKFSQIDGTITQVLDDKGHMNEEVLEKKFGSKAYECAVISESTVEYFNERVSYYAPLRNEEHKTVFVFEISSEKYYKNQEKYQDELTQIETVLYVLHKCQEELLETHFLGNKNFKYEYETFNEKDKFEILFEKCYINYISEVLKENINNPISIADSEVSYNIIKFIADLTETKEFDEKKIIDESLVDKISNIDPTLKEFKFPSTHVNFSTQEVLHDLHSSLDNSMSLFKNLIDYVCLLFQLKSKSKII